MLERLNEIILDLKARLDRQPTFGWAVVTSVSPLMIRYDAQAEAIAGTPSRLVSGLAVGDRVWCQRVHRRDIVLGRGGGAANTVLWSGAIYMHGTQTATLSHLVSDQETGIVLVWQAYSGGELKSYDVVHTFVPKWHATDRAGVGLQCTIWSGNSASGPFQKYVYVHNDRITGNAMNAEAPRNGHVLTAVLGV